MLNIICEKKILSEAVTPALSAVAAKSTDKDKGLDGFLLTADKDAGTLTICGYDLEKGVKTTISGENVQVSESGSIIVNADKFSAVIKNLPDGNVLVSANDKFIVNVTNGKSEFTLHGLESKSYPKLPALKGKKSLKLSRKILKSMIASTLFSVAYNNNSRPALNGALFAIKGNKLEVVGCDGYRVAIRRSFEGITSSEELDLSFIIPGKSLSELLKLIGDGETPAEIELTNKHVIISFDNIIFFSRLIESEYLDYNRTLNVIANTTVTANTRNLAESVERAAVLTEDRQKTDIRLSFRNTENKDEAGVVQITSASSIGKSYDEFDIAMSGDDLDIAFNKRYLSEALKAVKDENILINAESSVKSMMILPHDKDKENACVDTCRFVYLVLPVRLKSA